MPTITRFEEIEAWKTARELTRMIYALTEHGRFSKDFGLRSQIQRAAVSVMSNIAEGFESRTQAQFLEYLGRSKASAGEVRCQLYIALDLKYLTQEQFTHVFDLADKSSHQIARFMDYLEMHPQSRRVREEGSGYEV
ncbi:MAG: four helix bundle protein [Anaerolineales bacterium]|nr:MAG: four helix bundle protein [Anaerolineales bacterium]